MIKSQALEDFCGRMDRDTIATPTPWIIQVYWSMYFDGSFTLNGVGGGMVLISPKGDWRIYVIQLHFRATNDVAEYEALVNGMCITVKHGVQ
jgi:hypothetical protein